MKKNVFVVAVMLGVCVLGMSGCNKSAPSGDSSKETVQSTQNEGQAEAEVTEAEQKAEEAVQAEEDAQKEAEEAEEAKKAEEEKKAKEAEEAKKAEEEKKADEESQAEEIEEADNAEGTTENAEEAAPAAEEKVEVSRTYIEDCGMDTGYWEIVYSDGSVEYIDE